MILIGLSGKRGTGKSTLADILAITYGYKHVALAQPIKQKCQIEFFMSNEQVNGRLKEVVDTRYGKTPRQIMIEMGQFYRSIDPEYWIGELVRTVLLKEPQAQLKTFVIADVRFRNEANWIKEHGGYLVRLNRDPELSIYQGEINDPSETELDNYSSFDLVVPESWNVDRADLDKLAEHVATKVEEWEHAKRVA